jgi:hypothetical protein
MGLPAQNCQDITARSGLSEQDSHYRTAKTDSWDRTAGTGPLEHNSQIRTARKKIGQAGPEDRKWHTEQDYQYRTASTGLPVQDCQYRTA